MNGLRFATVLKRWYTNNFRDLPWRRTRDPYAIWVSEIMLQQTRVETVIPYYERFLARFPDVAALARASEADVLSAWSGLGYYSRARNLQRAACQIAKAGSFPRDFESILALPGIGAYTAAAVASIAFGEPRAAVDGNVLRVLSRIGNDSSDIGSQASKAAFQSQADALLDRKDPATFNQAMMELGATVCLPRAPRCLLCPVSAFCEARKEGTENQLPIKLRRAAMDEVEMTVAIVENAGRILMWKRESRGMMAGFWELPEAGLLPTLKRLRAAGAFMHTIMNRRYRVQVIAGRLAKAPARFQWIAMEALPTMPVSTIARKALAKCTS
ncbi:MAG: A/G-specific adenine glycosylase [Bryobacterales bacterium]|nr:A/G-specific adenine glycosylase [Bryobacterales bacterium]